MKKVLIPVVIAGVALGTSACSYDSKVAGVSVGGVLLGAALGAGAGAGIAAIASAHSLTTGAIIGATAGGIAGGVGGWHIAADNPGMINP